MSESDLNLKRAARFSFLVIGFLLAACTAGVTLDADGVTSTTLAKAITSSTGVTSTTSLDSTTSTTPVSETTFTTTAAFVRFIHPDEWTRIMEACMIDAGWPVTTTPDGGIEFPDRPEDQNPVLEADLELCREKFPVDPKYRQPLTVDQLTFLYNWFVNESIPCLEGEGYTDFDPPSLDVFIDTYDTEGWSPYRDLNTDQLGTDGWYSLTETCPQNPTVDQLFGN